MASVLQQAEIDIYDILNSYFLPVYDRCVIPEKWPWSRIRTVCHEINDINYWKFSSFFLVYIMFKIFGKIIWSHGSKIWDPDGLWQSKQYIVSVERGTLTNFHVWHMCCILQIEKLFSIMNNVIDNDSIIWSL